MPKPRKPDPHCEIFELAFIAEQVARGVKEPMPYFRQDYDFVHLTNLKKFAKTHNWELTIPRWRQAVENYFLSDVPCYRSLAHLCSKYPRFSAYYKSPCNRYGEPKSLGKSRHGSGVEAQIQALTETDFMAAWHPKFLRECFALTSRPECREAVFKLVEYAEDLTETEANHQLTLIRETKTRETLCVSE